MAKFKQIDSLVICAALVILIWVAFGQVRSFEFTNYDDPDYVLDNPHLTPLSFTNVKWALTTDYTGNWVPLTWFSHMLDVRLFGVRSGFHHLTNVLLHTLSALLCFAALRRMTGRSVPAAMVAALFALHPLRAESVAWVAERKDVLSTFFWMLTIWLYARYTECPGGVRYVTVVLSFALGLMAKPMLVTVPFTLLLLDLWPLQRIDRSNMWRRVVEKMPLLALSVAVAAISFVAQQHAGSVAPLQTVPLLLRLENVVISYAMYLRMLVWPARLVPFYPIPMTIPPWQPLIAAVSIGLISVLAWWKGRTDRYLIVGWLWYLVTLIPVIGFVLIGEQARADRYTYVPLIGVDMMIVWGAWNLARTHPRWMRVAQGTAIVALIACTLLTHRQVAYWRNSSTLFRYTIGVSKNNYLALNNLGVALSQRGEVDAAIDSYNRAMRIPRYFDVEAPYINIGAALILKDKASDAVPYLLQALRYNPQSAQAHLILGHALDDTNRTSEAVHQFREAVRLQPDNAEAHSGLGVALSKIGAGDEALAQVHEGLRLRPDFAGGWFDLGDVYGHLDQPHEAELAFRESIRLDASNPRAFSNLGIALGVQDKLGEAEEAFRTAVKLRPDYARAWFNLGSDLAQQDELAEAVRDFNEAIRLQADFPEAREALANIESVLHRPRRE